MVERSIGVGRLGLPGFARQPVRHVAGASSHPSMLPSKLAMHSLSLDMRRCLTCGHACNSNCVASRSTDQHVARPAHGGAHRRTEIWNRAPSGAAKRASRTTSGTAHGTSRAASGAAHRARRTTGRARRHQHNYNHRPEKVVGSFGPAEQPDHLSVPIVHDALFGTGFRKGNSENGFRLPVPS